jgi:hypothetical protein
MHKITSKDKIANFAFRYIIDEIRWTNSKTNRQNKFIESSTISPINEQDIELLDETTMELNIYLFLDEQEIYNKKKAAIQLYLNECNAVDKVIYEVYTQNNGMTCRQMGKHFNISSVSAWQYIKKMKNRINEIYSNL